ncbi:urate hydroxylase PuuD [Mitsuaria sp. GD03876]|uniref:urate hydroxylase PuuD n=1 Tax=Mitsuaria sp. GD03876 TaxID=2975399 RepID=UPI002449EDD9|nr:urate hydroxylase PuuD [Mitsuaria sp. GD03876]MDH0864599.1 urate hydroxylase PuuD [Mitsuaria sp. GD03876]
MDSYLLDWANLLLRWLHVIVAIAWIGASFYFVWLDNHLVKPRAEDLTAKGVDGELWAVHGGGFYNPQKYMVAPGNLPRDLHWFYWESYWTWMSGFALFALLYLFNADTYLIDKRVHDWSAPAAVAGALGFLAGGWIVYDQICRRFGRKADGSIGNDGVVLGLIAVVIVAAAWGASQLFAGRAAFLITGAMIATMMSANVFFWIIPGQKQVIADMRAGRPVDPVHGQRGKQRSVHNTYFTLPVLIAMLSNHYGMLYSHPRNWLVLVVLMLVGALVRTWFVKRHKGFDAWPLLVAVAMLLAGLITALAPSPAMVPVTAPPAAGTTVGSAGSAAPAATAGEGPVSVEQVRQIVNARCLACHNAALAPKRIQFHEPQMIEQHAAEIYQQVVVQKTMPLNNATGITDEERATLGRWFKER